METVKLQKKIEMQEVQHLVKLEREKNSLDVQKKEVELKDKFKDKEMELMRKNHADSLRLVEKSHEDMKKMYEEIMKRLPNVNMDIFKGVK